MDNLELVQKINKIKQEKNAVILAHFYQNNEIQDIADYIGDSLQLSQIAATTKADIIVFAGVNFMAETAKILAPKKIVLLPDLEAGCSLADSIKAEDFKEFKKNYPNHTVISYVNTTAEIKTMSDICCTSSNAVAIVNSLPKNEKIIFTPDRNLGDYINRITDRQMVVWDGACHVHEQFSLEGILELKKNNPDAKIIAHPECQKPILLISDFIGSTAALLKFTKTDSSNKYIVVTESGILHQMKISNPKKSYIPAPAIDSSCGCNNCEFMKLISLEKIYNSLKNNEFVINLPDNIINKAIIPIQRMLDISKKLGIL